LAFLEKELQSDAAKAAAWKFAFSHYPIYSTGDHGASGVPALEKLCDKYGVAVYFDGHDHIYERTHQIYAGKAIDPGSKLTAGKGTVYIVSGGGGAPLYAVGKEWWTHLAKSVNNYCEIFAEDNLLTLKAYQPGGQVVDSFTIAKAPIAVAPGPRPAARAQWLRAELVSAQGFAILSFAPVADTQGLLEITAPDGKV